MQLNEWKEKDASEQNFLLHKELVAANDWLRLIHVTLERARKAAERESGPDQIPSESGTVEGRPIP